MSNDDDEQVGMTFRTKKWVREGLRVISKRNGRAMANQLSVNTEKFVKENLKKEPNDD